MRRVAAARCCWCVTVVAGGGVAAARSTPTLHASGPVGVAGTEASAAFTVADRTVRQVRYVDRGTLRYTFRLTNDGRLPVTVLGLADGQPDPRLFDLVRTVARRPRRPARPRRSR